MSCPGALSIVFRLVSPVDTRQAEIKSGSQAARVSSDASCNKKAFIYSHHTGRSRACVHPLRIILLRLSSISQHLISPLSRNLQAHREPLPLLRACHHTRRHTGRSLLLSSDVTVRSSTSLRAHGSLHRNNVLLRVERVAHGLQPLLLSVLPAPAETAAGHAHVVCVAHVGVLGHGVARFALASCLLRWDSACGHGCWRDWCRLGRTRSNGDWVLCCRLFGGGACGRCDGASSTGGTGDGFWRINLVGRFRRRVRGLGNRVLAASHLLGS